MRRKNLTLSIEDPKKRRTSQNFFDISMQRSSNYINGLASQTSMMVRTHSKHELKEQKMAKQLSDLSKQQEYDQKKKIKERKEKEEQFYTSILEKRKKERIDNAKRYRDLMNQSMQSLKIHDEYISQKTQIQSRNNLRWRNNTIKIISERQIQEEKDLKSLEEQVHHKFQKS